LGYDQSGQKGRSIVLCSHHLEEVDLLRNRVLAILEKGKIITAGTTLFLKHNFGVEYSLRFEASEDLCASVYVAGATSLPSDKPGA
jgi:ABC-type multidrug transport system ATPase subunit